MTCIRCKHNTAYKFGTYGKRKVQRYRCHSCKVFRPRRLLSMGYSRKRIVIK